MKHLRLLLKPLVSLTCVLCLLCTSSVLAEDISQVQAVAGISGEVKQRVASTYTETGQADKSARDFAASGRHHRGSAVHATAEDMFPRPKSLPVFLGHAMPLANHMGKLQGRISTHSHYLPSKAAFLLASSTSGLIIHLVDGVTSPFYKLVLPKGHAHHIPNLQVKIKNNIISIIANNDTSYYSHHPVEMIVAINQLRGISILGLTSLHADAMSHELAALYVNSSWPVILHGVMAPDYILDRGHGVLALRWLEVGTLNVAALGDSQIELDGVANVLRASLSQHSQLNGRYLHVNNCYVHAADNSTARLWVDDTLHAFAYDKSNVMYYNIPRHLSRVTDQSGNVLQSADLSV